VRSQELVQFRQRELNVIVIETFLLLWNKQGFLLVPKQKWNIFNTKTYLTKYEEKKKLELIFICVQGEGNI